MSIPTPSLPFWDNLQFTLGWEQKRQMHQKSFEKSFIHQCYFVCFFVYMSISSFFLILLTMLSKNILDPVWKISKKHPITVACGLFLCLNHIYWQSFFLYRRAQFLSVQLRTYFNILKLLKVVLWRKSHLSYLSHFET